MIGQPIRQIQRLACGCLMTTEYVIVGTQPTQHLTFDAKVQSVRVVPCERHRPAQGEER